METEFVPRFLTLKISMACLLGSHFCALAQNASPDSPYVNGRITALVETYSTNSSVPRYKNFSASLLGDLSFQIRRWHIPLRFILSEKERSFRQAFNQAGISPEWRSLRFHAGYRNIFFSNFSLAGLTILGGGVEMNPGSFRFGAVYGRLQRKVSPDSTDEFGAQPAFERWGYAMRAGIGNTRNFFDVIFLHAADKKQSLQGKERAGLLPAENDVMAVSTKFALLKNVFFEADAGLSIYTRNVEDSSGEKPSEVPFARNSSSTALSALKASMIYKRNKWQLAAGYKRIEPEYRSMGTYFFQNDVEQLTISPRVSVVKGRLNLQASAGVERNNLLGLRASSTRRVIGNFRLGWQSNQRYRLDLQYTNNGMSEKKKWPMGDTSNVAQIQSLWSCTHSYFVIKEHKAHTLSGTLLHQRLQFSEAASHHESRYSSVNIGYVQTLFQSGLTLSTSAGYTSAQVAGLNTGTLNLNLSAQKSLYDSKLQTGITTNYQPSYNSGSYTGSFFMANATVGYTVQPKHTFSIDLSFQRQTDTSPYALMANAQEVRAIIAYQLIL